MSRRCCVPGCKGNYSKETYVSVFRFPPNKELSDMWVRNIHRENFSPTNNSVICIDHFFKRYIITEDSIKRDDGSTLTLARKSPKLSEDAVPTIFNNQPKYLSKHVAPKRKTPEERSNEGRERELKKQRELEIADAVPTFDEFRVNFKYKLKKYSDFVCLENSTKVSFCNISTIDEMPKIMGSLVINSDLNVKVFVKNCDVTSCDQSIRRILDNSCFLKNWSQFLKLYDYICTVSENNASDTANIEAVKCNIEKGFSILINTDCDIVSTDIRLKLNFLSEQFILAFSKIPRYSPEMFIWASALFFSFPGGYKMLRSNSSLTLPYPKHIQKLSLKLGSENTGITNCHRKYLSEKLKYLDSREKYVTLMLDEVYVKSDITYKGGKIEGVCSNEISDLASSTIQAFMISSYFSQNKDVVALYPVKNLTSDYLLKLLLNVVKVLTETGYHILTIISDNNRVNRKCFENMCGGTLVPSLKNPYDSNKTIFILFDTVHIIKCVRNNWLNQKDIYQTFRIPKFPYSEADQSVHNACVRDLKQLYISEQHKLVKMAPSLSSKSLFPSSLERQNVNLCLKLFDEKNISALEIHSGELSYGTVTFLQIVSSLWKIVNCKSKFAADRKRDNYRSAIYTMDDENVNFLKSFVKWVEAWNEIDCSPTCIGKLTKETHFALTHTIKAMIDLCHYLLNVLNFEYVLLGKFQSDDLEGRFGRYRGMYGSNYNITVSQILESERKLKILDLLKLQSSKHGEFQIKDFLSLCEAELPIDRDDEDATHFQDIDTSLINYSDNDIKVLIYIGGYIVQKTSHTKIQCIHCQRKLSCNRELLIEIDSHDTYRYLEFIDRGGLKYPSEYLVNIVLKAYSIFQVSISERFEIDFLNVKCQKSVLVKLTLDELQLEHNNVV